MHTYLLAAVLCFFSTNLFAQHWSYSGSISNHLQSEHGQSVAGLTTEQMLNLHDSLHYAEKYNRPTLAPALPLYNRVREVRPLRSVLLNNAPVRTVLQRSTNRVRLTLSRVRNLCSR